MTTQEDTLKSPMHGNINPIDGPATGFIMLPKTFTSGRRGWYAQLLVVINGKTYKGSVMLYGEKP